MTDTKRITSQISLSPAVSYSCILHQRPRLSDSSANKGKCSLRRTTASDVNARPQLSLLKNTNDERLYWKAPVTPWPCHWICFPTISVSYWNFLRCARTSCTMSTSLTQQHMCFKCRCKGSGSLHWLSSGGQLELWKPSSNLNCAELIIEHHWLFCHSAVDSFLLPSLSHPQLGVHLCAIKGQKYKMYEYDMDINFHFRQHINLFHESEQFERKVVI